MFFVISGFLITTIIVGSLGQQAFSFVEFYRRRVERIFPALLVVLISVLAAGWYLLLASEYAELGKHVTAGAGFLSNIVLYSESGYFDAAAESKPLLHLWSLGIEEQYYILWPAILYGAHLARWSLLRCAFALAVLSFAANCVALDAHRVATFYLPFTRFWELLVGSTLACAMAAHPQTCTRVLSRSRTGLSTVGAVLMVGSLVFIRPDFAFPGWWALAPTLGAAALIAAGPTGPINAMVLSRPFMVWIGKISFPLYLWHWPLLAFARIFCGEEVPATGRLTAVAASLVLAWATTALVERPLRFGRRHSAKPIGLVLSVTVVGAAGWAIWISQGAPERPLARLTERFRAPPKESTTLEPRFDGDALQIAVLAGRSEQRVLFVGDSLMVQYLPRVAALYDARDSVPDYTAAFAARSGCRPVPRGARINSPGRPCDEIYRAVMQLANGALYRRIVVAANWETIFADTDASGNVAQMESDFSKLRAAGKSIVLIAMNPHSPLLSPQHLARPFRTASITGATTPPTPTQWVPRAAVAGDAPALARLAAFAERVGATVIDPYPYFCDAARCVAMENGAPINSDTYHLSELAVRNHANFMDTLVGARPATLPLTPPASH